MPVGIWEKVRRGAWKEPHQEKAVERSPTLRCALVRCAMAEAAADCSMDAALSVVDLEKFNCTFRIDCLVDAASFLKHHYASCPSTSWRGASGHPVPGGRLRLPVVSILQGSRNSNS